MDPESITAYIESNLLIPESHGIPGQHADEREQKLLKVMKGNDRLDIETLADAERIIERIMMRAVSRMFHRNFHSAHTVTCYLVLLYRQIMNLFAIADGLRFGLPPDVIMQNIICEE